MLIVNPTQYKLHTACAYKCFEKIDCSLNKPLLSLLIHSVIPRSYVTRLLDLFLPSLQCAERQVLVSQQLCRPSSMAAVTPSRPQMTQTHPYKQSDLLLCRTSSLGFTMTEQYGRSNSITSSDDTEPSLQTIRSIIV